MPRRYGRIHFTDVTWQKKYKQTTRRRLDSNPWPLRITQVCNPPGPQCPGSLALFSLDFTNIFQYPTGNFLSSTEIREKLEIFQCIINSGIPVSFSGLRWDGKWASLECSGPVISGFFSEKNFGTQKTKPGMQTSNFTTLLSWVMHPLLRINKIQLQFVAKVVMNFIS